MRKTFDLSTLDLSAGTHEITVKARASGYADSPASNAVSYTVAGADTVQISGTWYFNRYIDEFVPIQSVRFTSNSTKFYGFDRETKTVYYRASGGVITAYDKDGGEDYKWANEDYRTITFDSVQTVSKKFYDWLVENAVRIDTVPIRAGTWLFNERLVHGNLSAIDIIPLNFISWDGVDEVISGSKAYSSIRHDTGEISFDNTWVGYIDGKWRSYLYRNIVVMENQTVTQKQYEWLVANAMYAEGN